MIAAEKELNTTLKMKVSFTYETELSRNVRLKYNSMYQWNLILTNTGAYSRGLG